MPLTEGEATIFIPGTGNMDVRRVTLVTPNAMSGGGEQTYTLKYDSVHDDTDSSGRPLAEGKVNDQREKDMPKDARAIAGNRDTFTESQLVRAGFFDIYNELNGTDYGPKVASRESEAQP
jgi:hypothetical protein